LVADELRRQADDFIELSELAALIARSPSERAPRTAPMAPPITARDGEGDDAEPMVRSA